MSDRKREGIVLFGSNSQRRMLEEAGHYCEMNGITYYSRFEVSTLPGPSPTYENARARLAKRFPGEMDDSFDSIVTCTLAAVMASAAVALLVNVEPEWGWIQGPSKRKWGLFGPRQKSGSFERQQTAAGRIFRREIFLWEAAWGCVPVYAMLPPDLGGVESPLTKADCTVLNADSLDHPAVAQVIEAARPNT